MPIRLTPPEASCRVFSYREGLLSGLGHDLELEVTRFEIDVDEEARTVAARFDPGSLRVVRALRDGTELPDALSDGDRATIERQTRQDVLDARHHPEIRFSSSAVVDADGGWDVAGTLALHGVERQITVRMRPEGDRMTASVRLHQADFGIRPYSALLGTLKVKPDVTVRVSVPAAPPRRGP
jgi:polyisoprenoid-binding protein YceI